jgi:hypothetical protein
MKEFPFHLQPPDFDIRETLSIASDHVPILIAVTMNTTLDSAGNAAVSYGHEP